MGGEDTGVTETTKNVLLESAYFRPGSVRRTARRLNLPSDASYRFERGVDPAMILPASQRATELIRELAAGSLRPKSPPPVNFRHRHRMLSLRYERCARLIGLPIPKERVDQILEGFGLKKTRAGEDETSWRIPSHRSDLQARSRLDRRSRARLWDRARSGRRPKPVHARVGSGSHLRFRVRTAATTCRARTLGSADLGIDPAHDRSVLAQTRSSCAIRSAKITSRCGRHCWPGLLDVLARNVRAGASSIRLFELGHVFVRAGRRGKDKVSGLSFRGNAQSKPHWRSPSRTSRSFRPERRDRGDWNRSIFLFSDRSDPISRSARRSCRARP